MLWSGLIRINKIVNNDVNSYLLYIDPSKSTYTIKNISDFYKEINNEYILNVQLNPLMLCNLYNKFKIKTTKKFIDIDFFNSNVYIKLDINDDNTIHVKTMTKTETQVNNKVKEETIQVIKEIKWTNRKKNTSIRKRFTTDLIEICKKIDN